MFPTPHLDRLYKALVVPDLPVNPPEPEYDPQITREDYEYQPPDERAAVVDEALIGIEELESSLRFLNRADPDAEENFPGARDALDLLAALLKAHRPKIEEWL